MVKRFKVSKVKPVIEKEYYENFETKDSKTGKKIIKKVKVIRYKSKVAGSEIDEGKDEMIESINSKVKRRKHDVHKISKD